MFVAAEIDADEREEDIKIMIRNTRIALRISLRSKRQMFDKVVYLSRSNPVRLLHIRKRIDSGLVFRVLVRRSVGSRNLRKGAATNAVQIAEKLIEKGFLPKE